MTAVLPHLAAGGSAYLESGRRIVPRPPWTEIAARRAGGVFWHLWKAEQ